MAFLAVPLDTTGAQPGILVLGFLVLLLSFPFTLRSRGLR